MMNSLRCPGCLRVLVSALVAAVFLGLPAFPAATSAQEHPAPESGDADEVFRAGRALYDSDPAVALETFRRAFAMSGSPVAHLYVARCLRNLGRLAEAAEEYVAVAEEARLGGADVRYERVRQTALQELDNISARLARIVVRLEGDARDAAVFVEGRRVRPERDVFVEPGVVEVRAEHDGRVAVARREVAAGARDEIELLAPGHEDARSSRHDDGSSSPREPSDEDATGELLVWAGAAGFVLSAVGLGIGAGLQLAADDRHGELVAMCSSGCPPQAPALAEEGRAFETAGNAVLVTAAVVAAASVVALAVGLAPSPERSREPRAFLRF